jgi:hypothetical protein
MRIAIIAYCLLAAIFLFGLTLREELRQERRPRASSPKSALFLVKTKTDIRDSVHRRLS